MNNDQRTICCVFGALVVLSVAWGVCSFAGLIHYKAHWADYAFGVWGTLLNPLFFAYFCLAYYLLADDLDEAGR